MGLRPLLVVGAAPPGSPCSFSLARAPTMGRAPRAAPRRRRREGRRRQGRRREGRRRARHVRFRRIGMGARSRDRRMLLLRRPRRGAERLASLRLRHRVPLLEPELPLHDRRSGAEPVCRYFAARERAEVRGLRPGGGGRLRGISRVDVRAAERVGRLSDARSASRGGSPVRRRLARCWLPVILERRGRPGTLPLRLGDRVVPGLRRRSGYGLPTLPVATGRVARAALPAQAGTANAANLAARRPPPCPELAGAAPSPDDRDRLIPPRNRRL